MVTKKTSNDEMKKVSAPAKKAAVKTSEKKAAPVSTKALEKKVSQKKAPAKVSEAKVAPKALNKEETSKSLENKAEKTAAKPASTSNDVVATVLEVKAKNEAKKAAKSAKVKTATASEIKAEVEDKGRKAVSPKSKRDAVKESAQKAEAKKFLNLKEESELKKECTCCCYFSGFKTMLGAWFDAYRKIFDYKTRSSRYGFWAFSLVNLIFFLLISTPYRNTLFDGGVMNVILQFAYLGLILVMMFASLALVVRRLHDMGESGWKGFFAPLTYSAVGLIVLSIIGDFVISDDVRPEELESLSGSLLGVAVLILLLVNFYYLCKTFIAASFMEGDQAQNAYGLPIFADDCTKAQVLRYASLYMVIFSIYMAIVLVALHYIFAYAMLRNGGVLY